MLLAGFFFRCLLMMYSSRSRAPRRQARADQRGFTLLEIIVVVLIIGILASMVAVNVLPAAPKARIAAAKADVQSIASALETYRLDNFSYPSTEQGLAALISKPGGQPEAPNWQDGGYLRDGMPKDPWGRPYLYLNPGQRGAIDVYSLGRDGKAGGEGEDADIGNWKDSKPQ
jgi:general secretion pathway protein G